MIEEPASVSDAPPAPQALAPADPVREPHDFPLVGIGASAGGLKALLGLFKDLPADLNMAIVVVQHLDPNQESVLPTLLANGSRLDISPAQDGTVVRPGKVYIITPGTVVTMHGGMLKVTARSAGPQLLIDVFLRSLAENHPGRAIAIILSGTGSDGTLGLAAVHAAGGITFAQDQSAEYAGMPQSAISGGQVDFIRSPADMSRELIRIAAAGLPFADRAAAQPGSDESALVLAASGNEPRYYAAIIAHLLHATGIDFTHYRTTTIMRRTLRRMAMIAKENLGEYAAYLGEQPDEIEHLAQDILIHVTCFYRDHAVFAVLKSVVFPALSALRSDGAPLRIWVVGCSTGQEVYSLAIEMMEHLASSQNPTQRIQIFATDISMWALTSARLGCYPDSIAEEIPADRLAKYFTRDGAGYRISKSIRDLCVFAKHDITADTPFSHIDLISCRNVLIYLGPVLQKHVLPTFHFSLNRGGYLLLGTSESLGRSAPLYETVDEKNRVYRSVEAPRQLTSRLTSLPRPSLPLAPQPTSPPPASLAETQRAADQILLGRFAPAGVLVTVAMEIVQFRGDTNPFLQPAQGEATLNLLALVPFAMAEALREGVSEVHRTHLPVRREGIALSRGASFREIAIEIIPVKVPANPTCFLILFRDAAEPPAADLGTSRTVTPPNAGNPSEDQRMLLQLRRELAAATDYVHTLVQLNHQQSEMLKEAQEETQSSSEEFRSTNEELQTTKEEIESTNEELVTINEELRSTNEQLGKASAGLRASGELTAAIIETMRYPLLVLAANLRVESANLAFLDTFQVNLHETLGRSVYDLGNGQWNIPELRRLLEDILPNNSAFDDFEVAHDFGAIGRKTMLLNARRLTGAGDRQRLIVLVIADITERTRIARDLQTISNELVRSNAELDQFAAVASHDLQEPLRLMSNYIDLLQRRYGQLFDERAQSYMSYVTKGSQRMSEMIGAVLAYSRLGHQGGSIGLVDSAAALDVALGNLRTAIDDAHAVIERGQLPVVNADLVQLTQLFQNLVSNALKFHHPARTPTIAISASDNPTEWIFTVSDNGIGLDQADFGRIFNLFQRAHQDRDVMGCGIGLAICKKIVEHHQGRIWVVSQIDAGAAFNFSLPKERTA
jgi:two-component system CheB/CheR fusion protein